MLLKNLRAVRSASGLSRLRRLLGEGRAKEIVSLGAVLDTNEAARWAQRWGR